MVTKLIDSIYVAGGLGDCLFYTPLIRHLHNLHENKVIVYVHKLQHLEILKNNPYCDLFLIDYNEYPNLLDVPKSYSQLKKPSDPSPFYYMVFMPTLSFNVSASKAIAKTYDVELSNYDLDIFLSDKEIEIGKKIISNFRNPILINPTSSSSKNRMWYIERWNKVIEGLPNYTFIQVGVESEFLLEGVVDFRGTLNLREQLAILANSNFFLGVDSFWQHAAAALRIKSLVLFGDTSPNHFGHKNNINIYKNLSCSPCIDWIHGYNCPYSKKCMDLITVDNVLESIKFLLKK